MTTVVLLLPPLLELVPLLVPPLLLLTLRTVIQRRQTLPARGTVSNDGGKPARVRHVGAAAV